MLQLDQENQFYLQRLEESQKLYLDYQEIQFHQRHVLDFFVYPYIRNILGINEENSFKAILKSKFTKKKNFTRFVKSKLITTKDGKLKVVILKGQESFRIKSFIQSNIWVMLPSGKERFKKGETVDCFFPNYYNNNLI